MSQEGLSRNILPQIVSLGLFPFAKPEPTPTVLPVRNYPVIHLRPESPGHSRAVPVLHTLHRGSARKQVDKRVAKKSVY